MNIRLIAGPFFFAALVAFSAALAADAPEVPAGPIAEKKELLFSDDFERAELGKAWGEVVPTFVVENGASRARRPA